MNRAPVPPTTKYRSIVRSYSQGELDLDILGSDPQTKNPKKESKNHSLQRIMDSLLKPSATNTSSNGSVFNSN